MNKILLFTMLAFAFLPACKKTDQSTTLKERFEINTKNSSVDGNLIMGQAVTNANTFTLVFKNANQGTSATISADSVNGLSIKSTKVTLDTGSVKVQLSGTPVIDGTFLMTVKVVIDGVTYICTKEFYVDLPNITAITISLPADTLINNVVDSSKINFDINPYSSVFAIVAPAHLTAQITNNSRTNRTLTFYADNQFVSGDVIITSTFRSVPPVINTFHVSAFSGGVGTAANPFQIADTARLSKIRFAPDKAYQLIANITAPKTTLSATTLTGSFDGNGKTISNYVLNSTANNTGFFAAIGTTGSVKNLSFSNISVTGKDYTGGLAAVNNGTVTNVIVAGNISGGNYVAGIIGNNFGSINSSDASAVNVSGINNIATLAGNVNSGSSQAGNVVLSTSTSFPTEIYGVATVTTTPLAFTPSSGTITVTSVPANITATAGLGQQVVFTPAPGFISGNVKLTLKSGNLSAVRDIMVYSKRAGDVFDAGDGSSTSPYIISTEAALDSIMNAPTKYYQLTADINITMPWLPIRNFSGSIDGKGFKVNNLGLNTTIANSGFIGTNTGTVKNIQFLNVNFTTTTNTLGVVTGTNRGGTLQNIIVSGAVTSTNTGDTLGGIAGVLTNGGKITQCYAKLNIIASCGMVGGITGCLNSSATASEISFCGTAGSIEITAAKTRIGGILGRAGGTVVSGGIVKNCSSSMNIKSSGATAGNANGFGGIFGADQNAGIVPIDQCMFTGYISAGFSIGGIAGVGSNISNCIVIGFGPGLGIPTLYATGTSPATGSVGGIAGTAKNSLQLCIVKNATLNSFVTSAALATGGITSTYQNNGYTAKSVVINTSITGSATAPNNEFAYRISGTAANGTGVNANNYAGANVTTPGRTTAFVDNTGGLDGLLQSSMPFSFFTGLGFSSSIWKTDTDGYPTLINVGYNGGYPLPG
jgi:hypothetical protein